GLESGSRWQREFGFLGIALRAYPQAKRDLIAQGRPAAEVEAMPVLQVLLIDATRHYHRLRDEIYAWTNLPFWQAKAAWSKLDKDMREVARKHPVSSLFILLLPALHQVSAASARLERRVAALRCIEAIRLHAAA